MAASFPCGHHVVQCCELPSYFLPTHPAIQLQSPMYAPYLGDLCKFFFVSSALHQLVFVVLSSLPFAIGQVRWVHVCWALHCEGGERTRGGVVSLDGT
jgi:hypothetical protein